MVPKECLPQLCKHPEHDYGTDNGTDEGTNQAINLKAQKCEEPAAHDTAYQAQEHVDKQAAA